MHLRSGSEMLDLAGVAAFAFDLDGTLVDSEPVWADAKAAVARSRGIGIGEADLQPFVGRSLRDFAAEALGIAGPDAARGVVAEIERLAMRDYGARIVAISGAADLVRALHGAGFRIAICSSASPEAIAASLDLLALTGIVELAVSASTLPQGKPHAAPYLEALARLGLGPQRVIAVEDTPAGIRSAKAAGLRTVTVGPGAGAGGVLHAARIGELVLGS